MIKRDKEFKKKSKILLLGNTGKIGSALNDAFENDYLVMGKHSTDFDALDAKQVRSVIEDTSPDIVLNTIALLGIDVCEKEPEKALRLNTLHPKLLAELSNEMEFLLIHFSTDAVFNGKKGDFYTETDAPCPLNMYGLTKYGGDCYIQTIARKYYIFRLSIVFGEATKNTQFVEKMLERVKNGEKVLKIADDIILSPTYSKDIARKIRKVVENALPYGLYHIANEGKATLYDIMREIIENLNLDVKVEKASYKDFPSIGVKNRCTPIKSEKIEGLRPWKEAVKEYCEKIKKQHVREDGSW